MTNSETCAERVHQWLRTAFLQYDCKQRWFIVHRRAWVDGNKSLYYSFCRDLFSSWFLRQMFHLASVFLIWETDNSPKEIGSSFSVFSSREGLRPTNIGQWKLQSTHSKNILILMQYSLPWPPQKFHTQVCILVVPAFSFTLWYNQPSFMLMIRFAVQYVQSICLFEIYWFPSFGTIWRKNSSGKLRYISPFWHRHYASQ